MGERVDLTPTTSLHSPLISTKAFEKIQSKFRADFETPLRRLKFSKYPLTTYENMIKQGYGYTNFQ
jgi:hypothetical protein